MSPIDDKRIHSETIGDIGVRPPSLLGIRGLTIRKSDYPTIRSEGAKFS